MSGGVDSSLAAARLLRQGLDVVGATLHLWDYPDDGVPSRCCAPEDVHDARRVADLLGFPHYAFDRRAEFAAEVVAPFVDGYLSGETPSPCVSCNRSIKLKQLMSLADRLGAERVATGHYARIVKREGRWELWRGVDRNKDQSYFLHMLGQETLSRLCFPLGDSTKSEVRAEASALGLPGAGKGESQELCFVSSGRYSDFVAERGKDRVRPGPILDSEGNQVGQHPGIHAFTVGQRRNLGVALGQRVYVTALDPESGTVRLGEKKELLARGADLDQLSLGAETSLPLSCEVEVRYRARPQPARVTARHGGARVLFDAPIEPVVKGQFAVLYDGERVLGGGRIHSPLSAPPSEAAA